MLLLWSATRGGVIRPVEPLTAPILGAHLLMYYPFWLAFCPWWSAPESESLPRFGLRDDARWRTGRMQTLALLWVHRRPLVYEYPASRAHAELGVVLVCEA